MTQINWHEQDVLLVIDGATKEMLLAMAHQVEAEAKIDMEVDTGFNRNSSYVIGAGENTFQARSQTLKSPKTGQSSVKSPKTGQSSVHKTVNTPAQPRHPDEVGIGFAANYAIYREVARPTLYRALVSVASQAGGIIEAIGKKRL